MNRDDLSERLHALTGMEVSALRAEWKRLYRSQPPVRISRQLLELGVAWKLQEAALGGLSRAIERQLGGSADTSGGASERRPSLIVKPGSRLVRAWGGETHDVLVVEGGYEWRGQRWTSLSKIAREITGTRWSGPRFFGLETPRSTRSAKAGEVAGV